MSEEEKELLTKYGCTTLFEFVDVVMDFDMCLKILKDYFKLQQENKQLKEQLEKSKLNHKQLKDLEKTQLLNNYQVEKINDLQKQLEQTDEVIKKTIDKIENLRMEKWSIQGTDIMDLLDILNKNKGDNK